jgi:hypothetical protein
MKIANAFVAVCRSVSGLFASDHFKISSPDGTYKFSIKFPGDDDMIDYDFVDAIQESLEEAEDQQKTHEEIWEVLARISEDVKTATGGGASFGLDQVDARLPADQDGHFAKLVVRSSAADDYFTREIATFSSSVSGYPVRIVFDEKSEWECDDCDDLCEVLAQICRETKFGQALRVAMERTKRSNERKAQAGINLSKAG